MYWLGNFQAQLRSQKHVDTSTRMARRWEPICASRVLAYCGGWVNIPESALGLRNDIAALVISYRFDTETLPR